MTGGWFNFGKYKSDKNNDILSLASKFDYLKEIE